MPTPSATPPPSSVLPTPLLPAVPASVATPTPRSLSAPPPTLPAPFRVPVASSALTPPCVQLFLSLHLVFGKPKLTFSFSPSFLYSSPSFVLSSFFPRPVSTASPFSRNACTHPDHQSNLEQCGACAAAGGADCTAIEGAESYVLLASARSSVDTDPPFSPTASVALPVSARFGPAPRTSRGRPTSTLALLATKPEHFTVFGLCGSLLRMFSHPHHLLFTTLIFIIHPSSRIHGSSLSPR